MARKRKRVKSTNTTLCGDYTQETSDEIVLSVIVLAYNHEKYIAQALDSILEQQVNFNIEVIVGDDASTDQTQEILREYNEMFPGIFQMILREKNLGPAGNDYDLHMRAKGKYIAHLEGDDFWICKNKLQKQVDFLENHTEYSACVHKYTIVDSDGSPQKNQLLWWQSDKDLYNVSAYEEGKLAGQTATLVNINFFLRKSYSIYKSALIPDRMYMLILLGHGEIIKLDDVMSCYRYLPFHKGSFSADVMINFKKRYELFEFRNQLEKYALDEFGIQLDLSIERRLIWENNVNFYLKNKTKENQKTMFKIISISPHPFLYACNFWWKIICNNIENFFEIPKNKYKKIRNRHHAYLIELLRKSVVCSQRELEIARESSNILIHLQMDIQQIQEENTELKKLLCLVLKSQNLISEEFEDDD